MGHFKWGKDHMDHPWRYAVPQTRKAPPPYALDHLHSQARYTTGPAHITAFSCNTPFSPPYSDMFHLQDQ